MDGNTALGASSPAKPAFTRPEPLSHTRAVVSSSSHMVFGFCKDRKAAEMHGRQLKRSRRLEHLRPYWRPTDAPGCDGSLAALPGLRAALSWGSWRPY